MHTIHIVIAVCLCLLILHLIGGLFHHARHYREHGEHPRLKYIWGRGWFASTRVPVIGGRYDHHISIRAVFATFVVVVAGLIITIAALMH